jgi:hypothetical protein
MPCVGTWRSIFRNSQVRTSGQVSRLVTGLILTAQKEAIDGLLCYRSFKGINRVLRMWIVRHGIPFKRVEDAEYIDFLAKVAAAK